MTLSTERGALHPGTLEVGEPAGPSALGVARQEVSPFGICSGLTVTVPRPFAGAVL